LHFFFLFGLFQQKKTRDRIPLVLKLLGFVT